VKSHRPKSSPANGLPENLQAGVENLSGMSMDDVRVHYNSSEPAEIGANAYAQGTDIHLGPGAEQTLPHEAWHVVQQKQGRASATDQIGDTGVNSDPSLESEADAMGARAASGAAGPAAGPLATGSASGAVAQRDLSSEVVDAMALAREARELLASGATEIPTSLSRRASALTTSKTKQVAGLAKVLAGGNQNLLGKRSGELESLIEGVSAVGARGLESRDGGHSLARHGPDITDEQLKTRLETGIAPDGALSPAPGMSTRFLSHEAYLQSRERAQASLKKALDATKKHVRPDLNKLGHRHGQLAKATEDLAAAPGAENAKKKVDAKKAFDDQATAVQQLIGAVGQATDGSIVPIRFNKAAQDPMDWVTLYGSYSVIIDNGAAIGTGFQGDDTSKGTAQPNPNRDPHDVWATSSSAGDLTHSRTGTEAPSKAERLFSEHSPSGWKVFQHFPVQEVAGIRV